MAKKPDESSRSQPEDRTFLFSEENPPLPDAVPPGSESDSAIDFGELSEEGMSGISVIEWASLIENPPSGSEAKPISTDDLLIEQTDLTEFLAEPEVILGDQPSAEDAGPGSAIDLTSSAEIIDLDGDEVALAASDLDEADIVLAAPVPSAEDAGASAVIDLGPSAEILAEEFTESPATPEEAVIDFGAVDLGEIDLGEVQSPGDSANISAIDLDDSAVIIEEEPIDLGAIQSPGDSAELSSIDLDQSAELLEDEPIAALLDDDEAIELGEDALVSGSSVAMLRDEDAIELGDDALIVEDAPERRPGEMGESGIDLGGLTGMPSAGHSGSAVNFLADDVLLEQPSNGPASGGSSRDLIAEGLESGVDLLGSKSKLPADQGDVIDEDFFAQVGQDEQSSSVDLGSMHSIPVFDMSNDAARSRKGVSGVDLGATEEEPEIDFSAISDKHSDIHLEAVSEEAEPDIDFSTIPDEPEATSSKSGKASAARVEEDDPDLAHIEQVAQPAPVDRRSAKPLKQKAPEPEDEPIADLGEEVIDDAPKPKAKKRKPVDDDDQPKPKSRAVAFVGGGTMGLIGGAAAMFAAFTFGLVPGGDSSPKGASGPVAAAGNGGAGAPQVAPVTFEKAMAQIRNGDLEKVEPADLEKVEEGKPEQLVARAEFHWLKYLRTIRGGNPQAPLSEAAEDVKKALADLDKAVASANPDASAEALLLRGQIHELTNKPEAARKDYVDGAKKFEANPALKERFETALNVMDLTRKVSRLVPTGLSPQMLALVLCMFQPMPGVAVPASPPEAGLAFWQALKEAKANKYPEAVKLLDEARSRHDQRRYVFPKRQQNPASDPREEIFLRACDLLKDHWLLLSRLNNPGYLDADPKDRIVQVDALIAKSAEEARVTVLKDVAAKLTRDKVATIDDLVKSLDADRKVKDTMIATLQKANTDQNTQILNLSDKLKESATVLVKTADTLKTTQADLKKSQSDGDAAVAALKEVGEAVGSDFTDLKTSKETLVREVKETARMAKTVDPKGTIRQLEKDLAADRARLSQRWAPAQMLTHWMPVLDRERDRKDLAARALQDAQRVEEDPLARNEAKAHALLVRGLVLRNEEKFAEAQMTLKKANAALAGTAGDALDRCEAALSEVSDPAATFARKAANLDAQGNRAEALATLERGLKVVPDPKGPLHVQRARIALESVRAKGPLNASDPLIADIRKDAAAAGSAEGSYLLGRLEEELGKLDEAEKHYRAALKAHAKDDAVGARYRIALARVLLRSRPTTLPSPRPLPPATRTSRLPLDGIGLLLVLTLQAPPADKAGPSEAERLADEVLALGDKAPFDARAQALAVKGMYTRAVNVYLAGLREKGLLSAEHANTLLDLVNNHPAMRRPEAKLTPDPLASEKHYSSGLNFYFARRFGDAEKEFLSAIENDNADARYYYFLGLSRLAQGKRRDAIEDFDQGARLEQAGRPDRAAVTQALERIQGGMRRQLNEVRSRPTRETAR